MLKRDQGAKKITREKGTQTWEEDQNRVCLPKLQVSKNKEPESMSAFSLMAESKLSEILCEEEDVKRELKPELSVSNLEAHSLETNDLCGRHAEKNNLQDRVNELESLVEDLNQVIFLGCQERAELQTKLSGERASTNQGTVVFPLRLAT